MSDAVFAWRQLCKHKVAAAVSILSLGLAIGACTAAFRLIDALFLRPLPVSDPQRLFVISRPEGGRGDGWEHLRFLRMREAMKDHAGLIAASFPERTDLVYGSGSTEQAQIQYVSGGMFRSFGLQPAAGRLLVESDDLPVAVLSYDYWTRRFGRDPKAVGRTVSIAPKYGMGSELFVIAGVLRPGFTGTEVGTGTEIFLPAVKHPLASMPIASMFRVFVKLPPGAAAGPFRERLSAFLHALDRENPEQFPYARNPILAMTRAAAGASDLQDTYGRGLAALGVLVALVLLIACANVANLLSAQGAARAREMALRVSLGAGRARLMRLVLVESAMLAVAAAAVGALVSWLAAPFVVARINPPDNPAQLPLEADWRVFAAGFAVTLAVTILVGLAPALHASGVRPAAALRGGDDPRSRGRLMRVLIGAQAAFCFLVLFVSGLFAATFARLATQPAGFPVKGLLALDTVAPRHEPYSAWAQVARHLRSVPGVESAAVSEWPLLDGIGYRPNNVDGSAVQFLIVSPGWIGTMGIPLIEGRDFMENETGVALVNREFARLHFPGESAVGRWFEAEPGGTWGHRFQIAGVVGDTRHRTVRDPVLPVAYIAYTVPWYKESLIVRAAPGLASVLRQEAERAMPGLRVTRIRTQEAMLEAQTVRERLLAMLAVFFAGVALLLAAVGLYGVLDYAVFTRRREIGIRMAVGAQAGEIVRRVTLDIAGWVAAGALAGLGLALGFARYIESLLYGVRTTDLGALALPALALLVAAGLAALPPVTRAVRTDPAAALRAE